jgi:hypothetical protein
MMRLTWKDAAATVLTAGVVALYAAYLAGAGLPLVSGPRVVAAVALVAGLGACAVGGTDLDRASRWTTYTGATLGGVAILAALVAMTTGLGAALAVLVGATVVLWVMATARHAFTGGARAPEHRSAPGPAVPRRS